MTAGRHKVALVGLGAMGARHGRVLSSLADRFEIVGGYDVRRDGGLPGIARLGSEADAIRFAEVLVVATPIAAHAETASRALAAGRHVLVEKPICATSAEAEGLVDLAARGSARLYVGHSERFNPVVRALARLTRETDVLAIDIERVGPSRPSEIGVLLNLAVHDLDLAAYLGGGPASVRGAVGCDDFADILFETRARTVGHLRVDRIAPARRRVMKLTTAEWIYEGDLLAHRLVRTSRATGLRTDVPLPLEEPLSAQARALADAVEGASSREIASGADGAAAVRLAELAARETALDRAENLVPCARA